MTLTDSATVGWQAPEEARQVPALAVAWCLAEPARVGEVALLRGPGPHILGRGTGPHHVAFVRQRPGASRRTEPLAAPRVSHEQLSVQVQGAKLHVRNTGRRELLVDGRATDEATVGPGSVLVVKNQLVLLVTRRPLALPLVPAWPGPLHPFGGPDPHGVVGESPAAWALRGRTARVAGLPVHVLVTGPSGAGKELVATALHVCSPRAKGPLVARNAATLPEGIADAELFGNVASYPQAGMPARGGLVGEADGGTLFLDEIGEVSEALQARLLRVLDEGAYTRLGEAAERRADLRLVAATNRDRSELKHDLAARLEVELAVPPLSERLEDIPLLARHLVRAMAHAQPDLGAQFFAGWDGQDGEPRMEPDLVVALLRCPWTHQVRELRAALWQVALESSGSYLACTDALRAQAQVALPTRAEPPSRAELEEALRVHDGDLAAVRSALGLASRHVLYRLLKKHGLS